VLVDLAGWSAKLHSALVGTWVLEHLLRLAGIATLAGGGALRAGRLGMAGAVVACAGLAGLAVAEVAHALDAATGDRLFSFTAPAMLLGLALIGIGMLVSRSWSGWHRITFLVAAILFPVIVGPSFALPGKAFMYALSLWSLTWLAIGAAALAEAKAPAVGSPSAAAAFSRRTG
jgi:hypothetical protein